MAAEMAALRAESAEKAKALAQVAEMVQSGKLKLVQETVAPAVEEDDTALIDRKELKRRENELRQQVAGAIMQTQAANATLLRANTKDLIRGKLKNFDKYEKEVDSLLDKMEPHVAANPDTIRKAYKVVRAEHLDDEIEEEVAARAAARSEDDYEEEETAPVQSAVRIPGAMASPTRGVAPAGDASGLARPASRTAGVQVRPLSREEKQAASLWGMNAEEFRRYGDRSWNPDLLGSKGRRKF